MRRLFILFKWILIFQANFALAGGFEASFVEGKKEIKGLNWNSSDSNRHPSVQKRNSDLYGPQYYVQLYGNYLAHSTHLIFKDRKIVTDSSGNFSIEVPVTGSEQRFSMIEVDNQGKVVRENAEIIVPEWSLISEVPKAVQKKDFLLSAGLGTSYLSYLQSDLTTRITTRFSQVALNAEIKLEYSLSRSWSVLGRGMASVFPLVSNQVGYSLNEVSLEAAAGWRIPWNSQLWKLQLFGGGSFKSSVSSLATFGYQNLQSFEMFVVLERTLRGGAEIWISPRFSPIYGGPAFLMGFNNDLALELGYRFPLSTRGRFFSIKADANLLSLQYSGDNNGTISSKSYTLSTLYSF